MVTLEQYINPNEQLYEQNLKNILFNDAIKDYYREFIEKALKPDLYGKTLQVSSSQYPQVYEIIKRMSNISEIDPPECFIYEDFYYGVESKGIDKPWLEISSKTICDFSKKELEFFIGKEICNIKLKHTENYAIVDQYLSVIDELPVIGKDTITSVEKVNLYKWFRSTNYTSDIYGLLMCGSIDDAVNAILKTILNSTYLVKNINLSSYLNQSEKINSLNDVVYNKTKLDEKIPYGVFRIKNLIAYVSSTMGMQSYVNAKGDYHA